MKTTLQTNKQKVGVSISLSDKTDFKTKAITRDKEEPNNSISGYLAKETQNANLKRHTHPCVHCIIIYNEST